MPEIIHEIHDSAIEDPTLVYNNVDDLLNNKDFNKGVRVILLVIEEGKPTQTVGVYDDSTVVSGIANAVVTYLNKNKIPSIPFMSEFQAQFFLETTQ